MAALLIMMLSISTASGCGRTTQQADTTGARAIFVPAAVDTIEAPESTAQTDDDAPRSPPPDPAPQKPPRPAERKTRKVWIPEPLAPQPFLGSVAPGPGAGWRR